MTVDSDVVYREPRKPWYNTALVDLFIILIHLSFPIGLPNYGHLYDLQPVYSKRNGLHMASIIKGVRSLKLFGITLHFISEVISVVLDYLKTILLMIYNLYAVKGMQDKIPVPKMPVKIEMADKIPVSSGAGWTKCWSYPINKHPFWCIQRPDNVEDIPQILH